MSFLGDKNEAIARAQRIAEEALTDKTAISSATQVALAYQNIDLACRLINLSPDDPDLNFHAGISKPIVKWVTRMGAGAS